MDFWKPGVTVAAVVEHDRRFLLVREHTSDGLRLNQPAGHLDPGESLPQAVVRETLEETAWEVEPQSCVGVYMARFHRPETDVTYLRFAFACRALRHDASRALDHGIVEAVWLTPDEVRACRAQHRSALVLETMEDYLAGRRYPLELIRTDPRCLHLPV
ncbi:MAG: NUDIX hydrolase [Burkholderiaceae bacterium]